MKSFKKPDNLNGTELLAELAAVGINLDIKTQLPVVEDNTVYLDITDEQETIAKSVIDSHNGTIISKESSIEDKLNSVGLNLNDLKIALGLNA